METRKIKRALVSVFHKDGLEEILRTLHAEGVELLSTGGTQSFIESLGIPCRKVEDVTTYPSILGGRVKTLHPKVFGGISLIRAAAKNFRDVIIVPSKAEYKPLLDLLKKQGAQSELADRKWFATQAFGVSSHYDTAIHSWFAE